MPNLIHTEDKVGSFAEKQKKADKKFERKFFSPSVSIKPWDLAERERCRDKVKERKVANSDLSNSFWPQLPSHPHPSPLFPLLPAKKGITLPSFLKCKTKDCHQQVKDFKYNLAMICSKNVHKPVKNSCLQKTMGGQSQESHEKRPKLQLLLHFWKVVSISSKVFMTEVMLHTTTWETAFCFVACRYQVLLSISAVKLAIDFYVR